jgi:signal transduction histidine kinase
MEESERKQITLKLYQKTKDIIVLINQFFDLAKLESKDHFLPLSRVHINEICRKNLIDFYELSKSKGLEVRAEIPDESFYILGNEEALNRILHNLISNAIRYGSDGNVLGLTLRTNDQYIAIEIWDQGKGIPETDQERVFERLYKLDDARHSSLQGSGLGLSITKRLVEEMRGTIYLKSVSHKKTIFTCEFKKMSY